MAKRKENSYIFDKFNDAQRVDLTDLEVEQSRNVKTDAALIFNHFGTGVLPYSAEQAVLFDSDSLDSDQAALVAANNFDGTGISPTSQPSDINLGNQLEIELTGSEPWGRFCVKVCIIGLSFDDQLQIDKLYFYKNEKQVTKNHYKRILTLFFNDFKGNNNCSRSLGGRITIKEAKSFQLSRDPVMISQDVSPDLFWRDFKAADTNLSLNQIVQDAIGSEYSFDALNIDIVGEDNQVLSASDVVTQVGQKFIAKSNNIQKITVLLGVSKNESASVADWYDWSGDLVFSVYALQSSVSCASDIVPELAIDFDPESQPLIQLSYSQSTLRDIGYVLSDVLQPVDFVLNDTKLSTPGNVTVDNYYVFTLKRSGAASNGEILIGTGTDRTENTRLTLFNSTWVDVSEKDLWFQVWTDSVKVSDGMAYESGNGIIISKTETDQTTGEIVDYKYDQKPFTTTGYNQLNIGVVQSVITETVKEQDERNGNQVNSRQQYTPSFSFVDESGLAQIKETQDPLIIGSVKDVNPKLNESLEKTLTIPGLAKNDTFCIINPDADLLSLNLLGSKLIPNVGCNAKDYRIFKTTLCTDGYGDVNGDGVIDISDISRASDLIGESIYYNSTQNKIISGEISTLELFRADVDGDGYITSDDVDLITSYVNKQTNSFPVGTSFTHICLQVQPSIGRYDGYFDCDGYIRDGYDETTIIDPSQLSIDELEYDGYISTSQIDNDTAFTTVPFEGVVYQIIPQPFWQPYLLLLSDDARFVPCVFTDNTGVTVTECDSSSNLCSELNSQPETVDPGKNDFFVPDNLVIKNGEILRADGSNYKVDVEIGTIVLQLPEIPLSNVSINIFEKLVADSGNGFTIAGYTPMKYSDCTNVQLEDLALGRIRFNVSIQSFYPNLDGYTEDGYGIIVDDIIGVYMDSTNGILQLYLKDLAEDNVYQTLVTKIQVTVYLKKAGWNNSVLVIPTDAIEGLISS